MFQHLTDRLKGKAPAGAKRSPRWRTVRREHLKQNPNCACCGGTKSVEVHHIVPFHLAPDMELEPGNLLTLCEAKKYGINCHQLVGHLGNYRRWNPAVRSDATVWNMKLIP